MASLTLVLLFDFVIILCIGKISDSFSFAMPPRLPGLAPVATSPSYGSEPSPYSHAAEPIYNPGPAYSSPTPATPSYGPNPYTPAPTSPALPAPAAVPTVPTVPAPEGVPTSPVVPAPAAVPAVPTVPAPEGVPTSPVVPAPAAVPTSPVVPAPEGVPTSPMVPAPEGVPTSPMVPAPEAPCAEPGPIASPPYVSPPKHSSEGIKAAYWPSFVGFPASDINTSYFTHIYYAFLLLEPDTFELNVTSFDQTKIPELIDALRSQNLPIKILLSIGGAGEDPNVFSRMASTKETRAVFINSTVEIARKYGFDGVDLDWEFPANAEEMSNLALLCKQWRKALNHEARISGNTRLLLTSAVYFASKFTTYGEPRSYPAYAITRYVDWINPMCYDYHGSWENFTGINSALYDPKTGISTSYGIGSWIEAGVPPKKLVMGLPLYGHTWKLQDPNINGIGAPALGPGPGGGTLDYNIIVEFNAGNNAVVKFDDQTVAYYSYAVDSWIGYDDVKSIKMKVSFAKSWGLAGYFFCALGQDKNWTISSQASNAWGR